MTHHNMQSALNEAQHIIAPVLDDLRYIRQDDAPMWLIELRQANSHLSAAIYRMQHEAQPHSNSSSK